nr:MAG TPA: hypothetical protein [Caudoviricetes sp.]
MLSVIALSLTDNKPVAIYCQNTSHCLYVLKPVILPYLLSTSR